MGGAEKENWAGGGHEAHVFETTGEVQDYFVAVQTEDTRVVGKLGIRS